MGWSKRSASKTAGVENPQTYPLGYVEDFFAPRKLLGAFFNILLPLSLFVPRILAEHPHDAFATNYFTF
jgi:hypothetical protein